MDNSGGTTPPPPPGGDTPAAGPPGGGMPMAPKTPGQIISGAFELYGQYWKQLIGLGAVYALVVFVAGLLIALLVSAAVSAGSGALAFVASILSIGLLFVAAFAMAGAVTRLVASDVAGAPIGISDSLSWGFKHFGPILVIALLSFLIIVAVEIVGALLTLVFFPFFILLLIAVFVVALGLSMAVPAFAVEGVTAGAALSRSWNLVKPHFWHALGVYALTMLIFWGVGIVLGIIGQASDVLAQILNLLLLIVAVPFVGLVAVLLYVNLRVKAGGVTQDTLRAELQANA